MITNQVNKESIQSWFLTNLAQKLKIDINEIDVQASFMDYGVSSIVMVEIEGELEEWLEVELDPTLLWDHPSIESLAEYLAEELLVTTNK